MSNDSKSYIQAIWGTALVCMGIALIFRIPETMQKLSNIPQYASGAWFLQFCMYAMAGLLIAGGINKLYRLVKRIK